MAEQNTARRRRSSSILQVYHEPPEPVEQLSDRAALPNGNANWVNAKGEGLPNPSSHRCSPLGGLQPRTLPTPQHSPNNVRRKPFIILES